MYIKVTKHTIYWQIRKPRFNNHKPVLPEPMTKTIATIGINMVVCFILLLVVVTAIID